MNYSTKQIHYLWSLYNQDRWRLDSDPAESARRCLEKAPEDVDIIPIAKESGVFALGFSLKYPISVVGSIIEELAMDGTCKRVMCFLATALDALTMATSPSQSIQTPRGAS